MRGGGISERAELVEVTAGADAGPAPEVHVHDTRIEGRNLQRIEEPIPHRSAEGVPHRGPVERDRQGASVPFEEDGVRLRPPLVSRWGAAMPRTRGRLGAE